MCRPCGILRWQAKKCYEWGSAAFRISAWAVFRWSENHLKLPVQDPYCLVSREPVSWAQGRSFLLPALPPRGGTLYITYTGMCRPTGSWFWSSWFRTGYPFQRRFLERGIIFRTHESSSFVTSYLKLFKDRMLFKIRFNALTSKLLYSLQPRTEYKKLAHF